MACHTYLTFACTFHTEIVWGATLLFIQYLWTVIIRVFFIFIIHFMDIQYSSLFCNIQKSNYGYPKIKLWVSTNSNFGHP